MNTRPLMFLVAAALSSLADVRADDVVTQILADWKERFERFESFEYHLAGTVFEPRGSLWRDASEEPMLPLHVRGPVPAQDFSYDVTSMILIDVPHGRVRKDSDRQIYHVNSGRYLPHGETMLFDGKDYQCCTPRERNTRQGFQPAKYQPDLSLDGPLTHGRLLHWPEWPILLSHGIVPVPLWPVDPTYLSRRPRPDLWSLQGAGKIAEVDCEILQIEAGYSGNRFLQYWVARSQHSAVRRIVWIYDKNEAARMDIEYERAEGEWLASRWQWSARDPQSNSHSRWEYRVKQRRLDVSPTVDAFRIAPQPGWVINDLRTEEQYLQGKPGEPNQPITREMIEAELGKRKD